MYSIREAKGLEFHSVLLLDFFVGLPARLQKGWRELLLGRDVSEVAESYPNLEGQIKLLYADVTRGIQQLFFFTETKSSASGDAFVRLLTTTSVLYDREDGDGHDEALAVNTFADKVERTVHTPDEWRSAGLDNALMTESATDGLSEAENWLEKAIYCFD